MEEVNIKHANSNISLYKKYKIFAYDFLFYYAIEVLFFTTVKHISLSELMYISAIYTLSSFFWQFYAGYIADRMGLKKSIVLGNILVFVNLIIYTNANSFWVFGLSNFFSGLGYSLKSLSEGNLLYSSLKHVKRRKDFEKIEGRSNSRFYILDAITSVISGFLFIINGYLPMICSIICSFISLLMSFGFKELIKEDDIEEKAKNNKHITIRKIIKDLKYVQSSSRIRAILLFSFVFWGSVSIVNTLYKAVILDIGIKDQYSTIIVCISTLFWAVGARGTHGIEKTLKNKTLTVFSYFMILAILTIGIVGIYNNLNIVSMSAILLAVSILGIIQGAYRVAIKKYVLSFTTSKIRNKITTTYYISEHLGKALMLIVSGILLNYTSNSSACVIVAFFSFITLTLILNYMKTRVGLKPEEYDSKDINNVKIDK